VLNGIGSMDVMTSEQHTRSSSEGVKDGLAIRQDMHVVQNLDDGLTLPSGGRCGGPSRRLAA